MVPQPTAPAPRQPLEQDVVRRWSDNSVTAVIDVLPGTLAWAPDSLRKKNEDPNVVPALDLCRHGAKPESKAGRYHVHHYSEEASGDAFGPLDLESALRFCYGLESRLQGRTAEDRRPLVLGTPRGDTNYLANAAVLLGAYLILRHGQSVSGVVGILGKEQAEATFACSWPQREPQHFLRVRHCWQGFELARARGWIAADAVREEAAMEEACSAYNHMLVCYDASWLVPGLVMVSADPTTVVHDPNPATCGRMFPLDEDNEKAEYPSGASNTTYATDSEPSSSLPESTSEHALNPDETPAAKEPDYVSFLLDSRICMSVRTNHDLEAGTPTDKYGYDDQALRRYGISQANFPVVDRHGGLPMPLDVRRFLRACEDVELGPEGGAVLMHCKAGFGRSVVFACCLAIYKLDIPGAALLGWARVVRPGAFTTRSQEALVDAMRGRKDVMCFARMNRPVEEVSGKSGASCMACRTQ